MQEKQETKTGKAKDDMWKDINGFNGRYQISDDGQVKSIKNNKEMILKARNDKDGYKLISLYKNKKIVTYRIHRLVAQHFLENPHNFPQINHKNEIKNDNRVENLEWCDCKYNINYGNHTQRAADKQRGRKHTAEHIEKIRLNSPKSKRVIMMDCKGLEIQRYRSASEAARAIQGNATNVIAVIKGRSNTYKGYTFKYDEG